MLLVLAVVHSAGWSQVVVRGPYLQTATPGSIIIKWRTDVPADSIVRYGLTPDSLDANNYSAAITTEHEITVGPLQPDTKYYYSVGTSGGDLAGGDGGHVFTTPPASGVDKATRIWVTGDAGTADANAAVVRDAYKAMTGARPTDLWLTLGDIAYQHGTDAQFQAALFNLYPELLRQTTIWPTFGNHDGYSADSDTQTGPYYEIFSLPTAAEAGGVASSTEAYYSFDYGNIHFISLDSFDSDRTSGGAMIPWLINDLTANDKQWTIAFWHHPPYSNGSHDSDADTELIQMRVNAVSVLESFGVDLVLTGHSHSYERSYLLNGHYGFSNTLEPGMILNSGSGREDESGAYFKPGVPGTPGEGAVYAVAGSSGKLAPAALDHPAMFISFVELGSMVLDVSGNRLEAQFIDQDGQVEDYFTLIKGADTFAPMVVLVETVDETEIEVLYSEPMDQASAEDTGNYDIDGPAILQAVLQPDQRTVVLTTTEMTPGASHTLMIGGVEDLSGNVVATDTQETFTVEKLVTIAFQQGVSPTPGYTGARDATIREFRPDSNRGHTFSLDVSGDAPFGTGQDFSVLLYWDVSQVPDNVLVRSARIEAEVTGTSANLYPIFEVKRDWLEMEVTWNIYGGYQPWATPGAQGSADRGATVLGTTVGSILGRRTFTFNSAGIALIQAWVDGTKPNYGFILADSQYDNGLQITSKDAATPESRPRLIIEYAELPVPSDIDADGVADELDNCIAVPNGPLIPDAGGNSQLDTDNDGYGNFCDPDLTNDGITTVTDFLSLRSKLNTTDPDADLDGDGFVSVTDFLILRQYLNKPPGPSGLAP